MQRIRYQAARVELALNDRSGSNATGAAGLPTLDFRCSPLATKIARHCNMRDGPTGDSSTAVSVIVAGLTRQGRNWPRHGKKQTSRKYEE